MVDDRLRRGADDQRLVELLAAAVGDDRRLGREALDMLRLLLEEALRYEQREVGVPVARLLEHVVERALHPLPDAVAIGANDHAAAHRRVVGQLGAKNDFVVPGAEVFSAGRKFFVVSHSVGQWDSDRYTSIPGLLRSTARSDSSVAGLSARAFMRGELASSPRAST